MGEKLIETFFIKKLGHLLLLYTLLLHSNVVMWYICNVICQFILFTTLEGGGESRIESQGEKKVIKQSTIMNKPPI